jgi:hypothetical protein
MDPMSFWMTAFYRGLTRFRLLRMYSDLLCRFGIYPAQYQPGVCGWCGKPHVKPNAHWRRLGVRNYPQGHQPLPGA